MTKHRGTTTPKPQWWKHLKMFKRDFWKRDRRAGKKEST